MDPDSLEQNLREASCLGDIERVNKLVLDGVNINSKNTVNGWTALHWAAVRNHKQIVEFLLKNGADPQMTNLKGETPSHLTENKEIRDLLGSSPPNVSIPELPIIPSYLKYRTLPGKCEDAAMKSQTSQIIINNNGNNNNDELVLKVRIANCGDPDFIEVELKKTELTFAHLIKVCCEELYTQLSQIRKVRKLPDTILRKDKDVQRLRDYQEIELVLSTPTNNSSNNVLLTNPLTTTNGNGYESIYLRKNQTVLY